MKRLLLAVLISSAVIFLPVSQAISAPNTYGITNTRHNLMTPWSAMTLVSAFNKYGEVCVYCHTPHGAQNSSAPLWNRALPATGNYTPYSSSTIDVNGGAIPPPDGISLACLSCHDGTIAVDTIVNAPGSGTNLTGPWYGNPASSEHYALAQPGQSTQGTGTCLLCHRQGGLLTDPNVWFDVAALTQDLSRQHPVSMSYPTPAQDPKFTQNFTTVGSARFIDENSNNRADDNEIRLYQTGGEYKVQCATCHNPHGTLSTDGVNLYPTFLRKTNSNSAVCTACHIK